MSIRKIYYLAFVILLFTAIIMLPSSCNKTGYTVKITGADSSTEIITASDELNVNYEIDQAVNEALLATTVSRIASGDTSTAPNGGLFNTITNVVIDTSHIVDSSLIRLTYAGKNADLTKGRSGTVTVQYARDNNGKIIPWKNAGAAITLTFSQYEVVVLATNVSVWVNGTVTVTNVSGGLLKGPANINLPAGNSLQDKINGQIIFTYDDNAAVIETWTWDLNQARTFTLAGGIITSSINGDTTVNGTAHVSTTGATRFNEIFYTGVTTPVVQTIPSSFLLSNPTSGEKNILGIKEPIDIVYGVDQHGNPVVSGAPYGFKISWVVSGTHAQTVVSY